jgi:carnitine O-acetyltransferase
VTSGLKEPDVIGKKKSPLCSSGYKYLFNSCRVPQLGADVSRLYNPGKHKHAIVACGGNFYSIPLKDEEGKPLNRLELEDLLYQCEESAITIDKDPLELGWLTAWNRDKWARAREFLFQRGGPEMAEALETIESSLLMINLDVDVTAESLQDQADNFWQGKNRWWDKTIQLYVTGNGQWSYLGEHSMVDGLVPVPFCEYLLNEAKFSRSAPGDERVLSSPGPTAVNVFQSAFAALSESDTQQVQKLIAEAKSDFLKQANDLEMHVNQFTSFGSDFIKKTGSSADAFAQMALQLASFRMVGKFVATYESTNTREYLHGRTEATRSVSTGSVAFCEAMGAKPKMDRSTEERQGLLKLLQQAAFKHSFYNKKASMGHGVDRHFFGLTQMIKYDEETPDLFKHPVFERSKHWRLSTSTLPTCPGFGMVVDDGLGVGYGVYENKLVFNIAAKRDTGYVQTFDKLLSEALEEMATLV